MRIASLLASATEIVCALDLADQLVAISHECDYPPEVLDRPRVSRPRFDPTGLTSAAIDAALRREMALHGGAYALDEERLRALRPDVLLTQAVCDVCAVPTSLAQQAAAALGPGVRVLSLDAHRTADILETVQSVGDVARVPERAARLVGTMRSRLARVRDAVAGATAPTVLALEWLEPPFVPGHWVPEMIEWAGGRCVSGTSGRPSRQVGWQELERADPDVLVVMPCGFDLERSKAEAASHASRLAAVAPRAAAAGRSFAVDGSSYFNRSGPRIVDGIEILAALLHPERVPGVNLTGRAHRLAGFAGRHLIAKGDR